MRDWEIRAALHAKLDLEHRDDSLIRHEVGLCAGQRRIDVALINGEFAGYEIKSDEDTLYRLAGQAEAYGRVLDRAILVTTNRYIDKATEELPHWWGVLLAKPEDGQIVFEVIREAELNSSHDAFALAQQLWRDEALDELRQRGLARGLGKKARYYVWQALVEALTIDELRAAVRARLKARLEWPGGQPHGPSGVMSQTTAIP